MKRKELFMSIGRKVLIAALLASAAFLFYQTDFFPAAARTAPAGEAARMDTAADAAAEAVKTLKPRAVLVRLPGGGTSASAWDGEETDAAFRRFSALLGEALGTAGAPEEIAESAFRAGTEAGCVYIDLGLELPLGLLSSWLGAGGGAAARSAGVLYLGLSEEQAVLCFRDAGGGYYRCATAAQNETLRVRMEEFQGTEAFFAWENELLAGVDPCAVILETLPEVYAVAGVSARDTADTEALMAAAGMNARLAASYYDAEGALVLMDEGRTLRLAPDGTLTCRNAGDAPEVAADDLAAAVNLACRLAARSAGALAGDGEIMFAGVEAGEGAYTVYFDYCVNGIPVHLAGGRAGTVTVSGGVLRRASFSLRRYTLYGGEETLLSMLRAAAIAGGGSTGGTPALVYFDSGERVQCAWVED